VTDVETALRELRLAVAQAVTPPSPAGIRARAMRRRRQLPRRLFSGLVAAAAAGAVLLTAVTVVRSIASAPPPVGWPSPSVSNTPAWIELAINDPIVRTTWLDATIILPAHSGCPDGRTQLRNGASAGWPRLVLAQPPSIGARPAYGDLTGDGRPEAVLYAECLQGPEDSGDGAGQLLVVTRGSDNSLRALGWIGPRGALYPEFWVADSTLYADAVPWHTDWGYVLGSALAYRWNGTRFDTAPSIYPGVREVDLRPVADSLGCPGAVVSLAAGEYAHGEYDFTPPTMPDGNPHVLDLAGDGHRYLVLALSCRNAGIVVVDGSRAVDFVPVDARYGMSGWSFSRGTLTVARFERGSGEPTTSETWVWNGFNFQQ